MTEEQEISGKVQELEERLAHTQKEFEEILYAISHDLKGPLRAILSSSMILIEDFGERLGEDGCEELNRQSRAARRLGGIVDDVLRMSRLGRQAMTVDTLDLSQLAEEVAARHSIGVEAKPEIIVANGLTAKADAKLMAMLLDELIGNAIKFGPKGRAATITIGMDDGAYFVQDDGIGFEPGNAGRIFKPFERLNGETEYPGTGIGLTLARLIVHRHNGKIWADAKPGEGTKVSFVLGS